MIIGNGLIAKAFKEYENNDDVVLFASGVSNSKVVSSEEFLREEKLLYKCLKNYSQEKHFVYFSTCSMYDTYFEMSSYTKHKVNMEQIIIENSDKFNIFRLPQVLGNNNENQLIGFLYKTIMNEKNFNLFNIERNIIDIDDVVFIVNKIVNAKKFINTIQNIANYKNTKVLHLVNILEKICNKKVNYNLIQMEGDFLIDVKNIEALLLKYDIFHENYIENRVKKYYE